MPQQRAIATREKLIKAATELIRQRGYAATSVDDLCEASGVTKGAFFHHFKSKDDLAEAALAAWDCRGAAMEARAPFQELTSPQERVLGYMNFFLSIFDNPNLIRSCLAGTTVQEVADTNPRLRDAANQCFVNAEKRFQHLLDTACRTAPKPVDTASLAQLWIATMQGSLILSKASQDGSIIRRNLEHLQAYIAGRLPRNGKSK